jgi:hypothetical protein
MPANKRKNRLFAFSSSVCQEASPPGQTLRARRIWFLRRRKGADNLAVFKSFQHTQAPNPLRRMEAVNGS